jgi:hypothetical protein
MLTKVFNVNGRQRIAAEYQSAAFGDARPQKAEDWRKKLQAKALIPVLCQPFRKRPAAVGEIDLPNGLRAESQRMELLMEHRADPKRFNLLGAKGDA